MRAEPVLAPFVINSENELLEKEELCSFFSQMMKGASTTPFVNESPKIPLIGYAPDSKPGKSDVTADGKKVTSEAPRPDTSSSQQVQQAEGTDVTDVKVGKVKNFVPHVEDFPDFTSVTSETSGSEAGACANDAASHPFSDVTPPEELSSAKMREMWNESPTPLP